MSQTSIRPSKEVEARLSFRKTQLEMPSQLLTNDFTSCSQKAESGYHTIVRLLILSTRNNEQLLHSYAVYEA